MLVGLQVGFGEAVGVDIYRDLKARGFEMVRVSLNLSDQQFTRVSRDAATTIVSEVLEAGLKPLVIIREVDQLFDVPERIDIEMGNEPDMGKFGWREGNAGDPRFPSYRDEAMKAVRVAAGRNPLWIGSASNLHARGFRLLSSLPWRDIPPEVGCSVHRYPASPGCHPNRGHAFKLGGMIRGTRDDEIKELRRIVGNRPLGLSEIGYNAMEWPDESQQAEYYAWERDFFERHGFAFAIGFQINSADPSIRDSEAHFGFRRFDGSWRPCVDAWCRASRSESTPAASVEQ